MKITPNVILFVVVVAILAWVLYGLDTQETLDRASMQGFQLVDGECYYYDGFNYCSVNKVKCINPGEAHLGFCEDIIDFTRTAGEACGTVETCTTTNNVTTCTTSEREQECDDGEFCDEALDICVDPEHVPSWSTADFSASGNETTVEQEFRADWDTWTENIEINKKYLWYGLFFAGILLALGLIFPIGGRR